MTTATPATVENYFVPCVNADWDCDNLADTRTGGDMNPYGPVRYTCDECIDRAVADWEDSGFGVY